MGRLRIFVSSTMLDLPNERAAVVERIGIANFEPVNAEDLPPNGMRSWERIAKEIAECDLFVLLSGDSYGWMPDSGPYAGSGKSVTELEWDEANRVGVPVLAFFKHLVYSSPREGEQAEKRDVFRRRVEAWGDGVFRGEFVLAKDLEEKVGLAIASVVGDSHRELIATRRLAHPVHVDPPPDPTATAPMVPPDLLAAVRAGRVVPFVGAGVSMPAGMPSAPAFADAILDRLREDIPTYEVPGSGTPLNALAQDLMTYGGRAALEDTVEQVMRPPWPIEPTTGHEVLARWFPQIVTTNFDALLEATVAGAGRAIIASEPEGALPNEFILKLHGDLTVPGSLVLTERDLADFRESRPRLWAATVELLRTHSLLAVGTSLRDPSVVALLHEVGASLTGWWVLPSPSPLDIARLREWGLTTIDATADAFGSSLDQELRAGTGDCQDDRSA